MKNVTIALKNAQLSQVLLAPLPFDEINAGMTPALINNVFDKRSLSDGLLASK
ncbi:MAG TPA: hypothetical protein VFS42_04790 [Burkholderiaceae bacterium]|nr:hypothetical protein [Burkholderiaceae bacterium]